MGINYMINIFADDKIYGNAYERVGVARPLNSVELSKLNVAVPAVVFQGQFNLSCRMFVAGSTTTFYCKSLDTKSVVSEGEFFDVTKCLVTEWRKPGTTEVKVKILVTAEAIVR